MKHATANADPRELDKFSDLASRWWDPGGECKPLHDINPLRLGYIEQYSGSLAGKRILDVGCGGGILSESMAARGARVTGLDLSREALNVAKLHLYESQLEVEYVHSGVEEYARHHPHSFDIVTSMEMLEHVPSPESVVSACTDLLKPDGQVFFSTLNRNLKSYLFAILGAEYILRMLPKGTHEYARFIRPAELSRWARSAGLKVRDLSGMEYNPLTRHYSLSRDISVNYLMYLES